MTDITEPRPTTGRGGISRRRLLQASGGVAAAAGVPGLASAQSSGEDGDDDVTTKGVLSNSTPKFGEDDYTGLFLKITGAKQNPDTKGVSSCDFVGATERIAAFTAVISEKQDNTGNAQQTTVYTTPKDSTIGEGKQYIINNQTSCSGGHVTVTLEEVGASSVDTASTAGTTGEGESEATDEGRSETSTPGFSVLTGIAGIGAAALAAARWRKIDE